MRGWPLYMGLLEWPPGPVADLGTDLDLEGLFEISLGYNSTLVWSWRFWPHLVLRNHFHCLVITDHVGNSHQIHSQNVVQSRLQLKTFLILFFVCKVICSVVIFRENGFALITSGSRYGGDLSVIITNVLLSKVKFFQKWLMLTAVHASLVQNEVDLVQAAARAIKLMGQAWNPEVL